MKRIVDVTKVIWLVIWEKDKLWGVALCCALSVLISTCLQLLGHAAGISEDLFFVFGGPALISFALWAYCVVHDLHCIVPPVFGKRR
ncbi:MAG: hypothetical protein Q7J45_01070 [bacterium]|nr:hypothetical protein [bacterium]